VKYEGEMKNGK